MSSSSQESVIFGRHYKPFAHHSTSKPWMSKKGIPLFAFAWRLFLLAQAQRYESTCISMVVSMLHAHIYRKEEEQERLGWEEACTDSPVLCNYKWQQMFYSQLRSISKRLRKENLVFRFDLSLFLSHGISWILQLKPHEDHDSSFRLYSGMLGVTFAALSDTRVKGKGNRGRPVYAWSASETLQFFSLIALFISTTVNHETGF